MTGIDASTPVVVLKASHYAGLGISRSLGRLGVRVRNIDSNPWNPVFISRYCRGKLVFDVDKASAEETVSFLLDAGRRSQCPSILIPTSDDTSVLISDYADALREWYIFPDQRPGLARQLSSKRGMYELAKQYSVPTPETAFPQSLREAADFAASAAFPVVVKGIDGARLKKQTGKRMFIVSNREELLDVYRSAEIPGDPNILLQEYIPGGEDTIWMFDGYFDRDSNCLVGFTGKKIRQNPVYTGPTCLGICLANDEVERTTKAFMKAIGYRGILDLGYRYDARDGQYKLLDVNPRVGCTFRLFVGSGGMDVVRALYLNLTGQGVPASSLREGRKWIVEDCDLVSCLRYRRDGKLSVREWASSFRGIEEGAFFAAGDPLPLVPRALLDAGELLRRAYGRIAGVPGPVKPLQDREGADPSLTL